MTQIVTRSRDSVRQNRIWNTDATNFWGYIGLETVPSFPSRTSPYPFDGARGTLNFPDPFASSGSTGLDIDIGQRAFRGLGGLFASAFAPSLPSTPVSGMVPSSTGELQNAAKEPSRPPFPPLPPFVRMPLVSRYLSQQISLRYRLI